MLFKSLICSALVALVATVRTAVADEFIITPDSEVYANGNITFDYTITNPLNSYSTYTISLYRNTSDSGTLETILQTDFIPETSGTLTYPLNNVEEGDNYFIRIEGSTGVSNSPNFTVEAAYYTESEIAAMNANETLAAVFKTIKQPQAGTRYTGDVILIIWELLTAGGKPASLDLVTSKNGLATTYKELATVQPNSTTYSWTIGADIPSDSYAIRLGYPASNSVVYSPTFNVVASKSANSTSSDAADIRLNNGFLAWSVPFATALTVRAGGAFLQ